jgi:hypothetical protein
VCSEDDAREIRGPARVIFSVASASGGGRGGVAVQDRASLSWPLLALSREIDRCVRTDVIGGVDGTTVTKGLPPFDSILKSRSPRVEAQYASTVRSEISVGSLDPGKLAHTLTP